MVSGAVGAGSETVSAGMQSFIYHMTGHQEAWLKARNDIQGAQKSGRCRGRVISYDDAQVCEADGTELSLADEHKLTLSMPRNCPTYRLV